MPRMGATNSTTISVSCQLIAVIRMSVITSSRPAATNCSRPHWMSSPMLSMSAVMRLTSTPALLRSKNAIDCACNRSNTVTRRSRRKPSPARLMARYCSAADEVADDDGDDDSRRPPGSARGCCRRRCRGRARSSRTPGRPRCTACDTRHQRDGPPDGAPVRLRELQRAAQHAAGLGAVELVLVADRAAGPHGQPITSHVVGIGSSSSSASAASTAR